jgi:hypothetical protein
MNHTLKYIKNICTAQENPVLDLKTKALKIRKNLKKAPARPLFGKS